LQPKLRKLIKQIINEVHKKHQPGGKKKQHSDVIGLYTPEFGALHFSRFYQIADVTQGNLIGT